MMAMRRSSALAIVLMLPGLLLLLPRTVRSSERWPLEVCQPILMGNAIVLSRCTYIEFLGPKRPGLEIGYTAKANSLPVSGMRAEDLNAANLYGLEVRVHPDTAWDSRWFTEKDTVESATVTVDARHPKRVSGYCLDVVIRATVEAILVNGAASRPPIRVLRVHVIGDSTLAKYGGVFHLQKLGRLPRTKEFY